MYVATRHQGTACYIVLLASMHALGPDDCARWKWSDLLLAIPCELILCPHPVDGMSVASDVFVLR